MKFIGKSSWFSDLAHNVQSESVYELWLFYHLKFTQRPCLYNLENVNNMLIQNGIARIDGSEKIDLVKQLRHFLEIFKSFTAKWDLRFNERS